MPDKPVMQKIAQSENMISKDEVHRFWVDSTSDFFSNRKTGIDISHVKDNYWKYLDLWEKQIALDNLSDGTVLDLGAGTGRITKFLHSHGKKVVSIDFVYECLTAIDNKGLNGSIANMDVTAIGLKESSIDCVVSCRVLQSLPTKEEKEAAVREISRILKRGGNLILTEGNPLRVKIVRVPYNFYLSPGEWKELLNKYGFSIQKVYGIPFLSASKVLDKLSFGFFSRFNLPFKVANFLDRQFKASFLKYLSLQFDIIAKKISD